MSKWNVEVAESAEEDLSRSARYIKDELGSRAAALDLVDEFERVIDALGEMPQSYPLVRDERLALVGYRWAPVKQYMLFFTVDDKAETVYVERLLYGRSDWQARI